MDIFKLRATLGLDSSEYESGLSKAKGLASGVGKFIGSGLKVVGAAVGAATAAVGAFGMSAVKVGSDFDSAMSQVSATLGYTTEDIKNNINGAGDAYNALRAKAEEAGRSTIFSASESAEGLNILAMSGFDAEKSIGMLDDVLHLAAAGSMDMASAAGYVSGAMKGFNDNTKDSAYYADLMAKGATLANTSVSQLGEAMSGGAASAAAYNQSAESMTVALLRLAEQGETGSAAGTALAAAMKDLYTGTDQSKKALEELGVQAFDPATGKARDFNDIVNDLQASMQGMTDEEQANYKQTIFGIQGLNAYNKMVVSSTEKQDAWAEALANSAGEAEKQYATMTDNLEGDIAGWNSALDGFKIAISEGAMGSIREFVQFGTDGLSRLTDAFKTDGLSGAMEALKGVLSDGVAMLTEEVPGFVDAGLQLLEAFGAALIDNAPTIFNALITIGGQIGNKLLELMQNVADMTRDFDFAGAASKVMDYIAQSFSGGNFGQLLSVGLEIVMNIANGIIQALPVILQGAVGILQALVNGISQKLPTLIPAAVKMIAEIAKTLTEPNTLVKIVQSAVQLIIALAQGLVNAIPDLLRAVPVIIQNLLTAIIAAAPQLLAGAAVLTSQLVLGLLSGIPELLMAGLELVTSIGGAITDATDIIKENGVQLVAGLLKGISDAWNGFISSVERFINDFVDRVKSILGISSPSKVFADIGNFLIQGLINGIQDMMEDLRRKADDIADAFSHLPEKLKEIGSNIIQGLWDGVQEKWNAIKDKFHDIADGFANIFKKDNEIASPSKKFKYYGRMIDEGLVSGLEKGLPEVRKAVYNLSDTVDSVDTVSGGTYTRNLDINSEESRSTTALADAFVKALDKYGLIVEMDNRELGRVVRREVLA